MDVSEIGGRLVGCCPHCSTPYNVPADGDSTGVILALQDRHLADSPECRAARELANENFEAALKDIQAAHRTGIESLRPPAGTPVPSALYQCSDKNCAAEYSWPARDLHWIGALNGWYCDSCHDCYPEEWVRGISLEDWLESVD